MLNYQNRPCGRIYAQANAPRAGMGLIPEMILVARPLSRADGGTLSFLRHDEIYRSDVTLKTLPCGPVLPPVGRPRGRVKGCDFDATPFPSSAMSLGLGIPRQVALQQSLPPLSQPEPLCNHKEWSVEQFSANSTCLTDSVSQNSPQSTHIDLRRDEISHR